MIGSPTVPINLTDYKSRMETLLLKVSPFPFFFLCSLSATPLRGYPLQGNLRIRLFLAVRQRAEGGDFLFVARRVLQIALPIEDG